MLIHFKDDHPIKRIWRSDHVWRISLHALSGLDEFDQDKECVFVLGLNRMNNIKYIDLVSLGSPTQALVEPGQIFRLAVHKCALSIILIHNHPSGNLKPSEQDIKVTQKIKNSGEILSIELLDHLIITKKGYFSFMDEKML